MDRKKTLGFVITTGVRFIRLYQSYPCGTGTLLSGILRIFVSVLNTIVSLMGGLSLGTVSLGNGLLKKTWGTIK